MAQANVLLLRTPQTDKGQQDPYETQLWSAGFNPCSLSVLETVQVNTGDLQRILCDGPVHQDLLGVIVTSGRAVEAWREAIRMLSESETDMKERGWNQVSFYVVGESTAAALREISASYPSSPHSPIEILGAGESGTSERLAHYIVSRLQQREGRKCLLYLTGEKNRDTLPDILSEAGIELLSLQVYETHGSSEFNPSLSSLLGLRSLEVNETPWWIVFFAPSAADFAVPILQRYFRLADRISSQQSPDDELISARIAAIGPTTSLHLEKALSLHVDVISPKPRPADLAGAIASCIEVSNSTQACN